MLARSTHLEAVQVLRGIAALSVAWFHIAAGTPAVATDSWLRASGAYGWLGVEMFFVVSGFVIPWSLARRGYRPIRDGGSFLARRIVRLEPAYLASLILVVLLQAASSLAPGSQAAMPNADTLWSLAFHPAYLVPWVDGTR